VQRRDMLLSGAVLVGSLVTLIFYGLLSVVQTANADTACESGRGIGFEDSFPNLGGRCTYHLDDGSVVATREPGWWFSSSIAGSVAVFAGLVFYLARRKGHAGWLYGLTTLVAPPLGLALAVGAPRRGRAAECL
jgi:hypothetical protein